jgi:twitching motility protein PilT
MEQDTAKNFPTDAKVYPSTESGMMSLVDMLAFFEKYGVMRVSDLHIKIGVQPAYRIDGNLVKLKGAAVTPDIAKSLIYPLLTDINREKLRTNNSVDCSYHYNTIHFRINVFQENDGISAAIRALSRDIPRIEDIGFPNDVWKDIINLKSGLVLLTGITGAGKSTTIASFIDRIASNRACRIITVEDPIEYVFTQRNSIISQREIGRDVKSFQDGLRSMLREDPDIIFVGEMRDAETIRMTLMAAETGHLVFSTLHTRDATGTITRVLDYFTGDRQQEVQNQLSLSLAYVISQKLIPKKDATGRLVAMEILNNNYACANLIRTGKVEQIYTQLQTKTQNTPEAKMISFEQHLAMLVKAGKVDLREAQKWANDLKTFIDFMNTA